MLCTRMPLDKVPAPDWPVTMLPPLKKSVAPAPEPPAPALDEPPRVMALVWLPMAPPPPPIDWTMMPMPLVPFVLIRPPVMVTVELPPLPPAPPS